MSWASTVPAALTGLVSTFGPMGVPIRKGTVVGGSSRQQVIVVGYEGENASAVEVALADAGPLAQQETYVVHCCIVVTAGGTGLDPVIERASALLEGVGAALAADQTLGGAVMRARLGPFGFVFQQSKQGAIVEVPFDVHVSAFPAR